MIRSILTLLVLCVVSLQAVALGIAWEQLDETEQRLLKPFAERWEHYLPNARRACRRAHSVGRTWTRNSVGG